MDDTEEVRDLIAGALHVPAAERGWFDQLMANIERDARTIDDGHALSEAEVDGDVADCINNLLRAGPVRVRVMAERSYWRPRKAPGSDIRLQCDRGREGWVRTRCWPHTDGSGWGAYVEDMGPGDDNNPSRLHRAHSLVVL